MNDEFEKHLKQQPLRQIPAEWRSEILSAAAQAQPACRSQFETPGSFLSTLNRRLTAVLWPHPVAWGAMAAAWIFVLGVHFSTGNDTPALTEKASLPSPEVVAELKQQKRMLAELLGANDLRDADRPKVFAPGPRSERVVIETA